MGVNIEAYRSLVVKGEAAKVDAKTNITYNVPEMRRHFNDAAQGKDVVTQNLLNDLAKGTDRALLRSDPVNPIKFSWDDLEDISGLYIKKQEGVLTPEMSKELQSRISVLSNASRIPVDMINTKLEIAYEKVSPGFSTKMHLSDPMEILIDENFDLNRLPLVIKQQRGETLSEAETAELERQGNSLIQEYQNDIGALSDLMAKRAAQGVLDAQDNQRLSELQDKLTRNYDVPAERASALLTEHAEWLKKRPAALQNAMALQSFDFISAITENEGNVAANIIIPDYSETDTAIYHAAMLPTNDLPGKKPPGTLDQWEFATALHEAEHLTQEMFSRGPDIDADRAMLKVLHDIGEPAIGEYWLQVRQINSFRANKENDVHDTATFLRIERESGGDQIDYRQFRHEKMGAVAQVHAKIDHPQNAKIGDLMGAAKDVLREGRLTPVQKAEIESFLQDADDVGYSPNPFYPKAKPQAESKADLAAPEQQEVSTFKPSAMTPAA